MENPTHSFRGKELCASAYIGIANQKQNSDGLEFAKEKRGYSLYRLFCPEEIFLTIVFYFNV